MSVLRYVVLRHTDVAEPHFDLLFEWEPGESLTSFRCPDWPPRVGDAFEERPDHRRAYLQFEGELSGDRGRVARVETGEVSNEIVASDPPTLSLRLGDRTVTIVNRVEGNTLTTWVVIAIG